MKITLPNGLTLEGTLDQIVDTASKLGYDFHKEKDYYFSESKGEWLAIKEMNTTHLRNAILKAYQKWVDGMHSITDPKELVKLMMNGITDKNWLALVKEYSTRPEEKPRGR